MWMSVYKCYPEINNSVDSNVQNKDRSMLLSYKYTVFTFGYSTSYRIIRLASEVLNALEL